MEEEEEGTATSPTATSPTPEKMMSLTIDTDVAFVALHIVSNWQRQKLMGDFEQPFEGEEDLGSESSVDLGEGSVQERDYPYPEYEDDYFVDPEDELAVYLDLLKFQDPKTDIDEVQRILRLPLDQVPRKYQGVKLSFRPFRNREEEAFYLHVAERSNRYEAPYFPERAPGDGSVIPDRYEIVHGSRSEELEGYCNQAITQYNRKKGTLYKLKYLIKAVGNVLEDNITFALTDGNYNPYVGRFGVTFTFNPKIPPIVHELRITRGEYRAPKWEDAKKQEYKCPVNEVYREKLPELEEKWRQKEHLKY